MSRFGPARLGGERAPSPTNKVAPSQGLSPKKKAFVSTIKSSDTFGVPPPLPPVNSPEGKWNLDQIMPDISYGVISDPDVLASSHIHLLQKQSVRWLNLSLNLWSLTVLDVFRTVSIENIAQFLEVVSWRAHGKINEEEFSVLYSEWVAKPDKVTATMLNSKRITVGVFGVRQLLLERKYGEADLDLCIGILLHEINMRLLNSSVSYVNKKANASNQQNPFSLEVCSERWLALCEELFFTLDTPGYGVLRFDEAFFYCTCVAVGMQGWLSEEELEADLSLATLTATTLQFLADAGASVQIRSYHQDQDLWWALEQQGQTGRKSRSTAGSAKPSNGKCEVTLSMFKRYFLKRNVGESSLATLLSHVQGCIERIARLAKVNGAEELYLACRPYELELGSIGSARLWQQAVLSASGHVYQTSGESSSSRSTPTNTPPIILFLLSDAERLLSGALRANELPIDGTGFVGGSAIGSTLMESPSAANEELHETVYRLWNQFRKWGTDSSAAQSTPSSQSRGLGGSGYFPHNVGQSELADVQRDPLYQLILTAVLQYKSLQQLLLAAFYDMTLTHFGVGENNSSQGSSAGPLVVICAGLVSNPQKLLVELGFTEDKSWTDTSGAVVGMRAGSNQHTPLRSDFSDNIASPNPNDLSDSYRSQTPEKDRVMDSPAVVAEVEQTVHTNESNSVSIPPVARRRSSRASRSDVAADSDSEYTAHTAVYPGSVGALDRSKAETVSSAARQRASQRIQDERRAALLVEGTSTGIESEIAKAKWSPLFSSQKALSSSASDKETPHSKRDLLNPPREVLTSRPAAQARATLTPKVSSSRTSVKDTSEIAAIANYSLSDEEAVLLGEILSTTDVTKQNDLIARMKRLRLPIEDANIRAAEARERRSDTTNTKTASSAFRSDSENESNGFGQFQKLEENVLSEHDRRLSERDAQANVPNPATHNQAGSDTASKPAATEASEQPAASDFASVGPSSIEELLQQGKGTGQYAQMLREILRKMSKDDTQLQLKSLEQVLALGHNIAQLDSQERLHEARIAHNHSHAASNHSLNNSGSLPGSGKKGKSPSPRKGRPPSAGYDEVFVSEDDFYASGREASYPLSSGPTSPGSRFRAGNNPTGNHNTSNANGNTGNSNARVFLSVAQHQQNNNAGRGNAISRVAKVPGLTPDPGAKKVKKVFGHAVK